MKSARTILCLVFGPVFYGAVAVPTITYLVSFFPKLQNEEGGTYHVGLTLTVLAIQFVVLTLGGYLAALVAGYKEAKHAWAMITLMLVIGVLVQASFWSSMLFWYHYLFFIAIIIGTWTGFQLRIQQKKTFTD